MYTERIYPAWPAQDHTRRGCGALRAAEELRAQSGRRRARAALPWSGAAARTATCKA